MEGDNLSRYDVMRPRRNRILWEEDEEEDKENVKKTGEKLLGNARFFKYCGWGEERERERKREDVKRNEMKG